MNFTPKNITTRLCSRACSGVFRRTKETRSCEQCGVVFSVGGGSSRGRASRVRRFCSHKCSGASRNQKKIRICENCGAEFTRKNHNQPRYCSVACMGSRISETHKVTLTCDRCGVTFDRWRSQRVGKKKYCSGECRAAGRVYTRGKDHPQYRGGGRFKNNSGYIVFELQGVRKLEHRVVMENSLCRPLTDHETVHHINGDRADNRIENLQLRQGKHGSGVVMRCLDCGSHNVQSDKIGG